MAAVQADFCVGALVNAAYRRDFVTSESFRGTPPLLLVVIQQEQPAT